jgi:hypothetical protein
VKEHSLLASIVLLVGISGIRHQVTVGYAAASHDLAAPNHPVQFGATVKLKSANGTNSKTAYTVPNGKRLVIEFVSAIYHQKTSDEYAHAAFSTGGPSFFLPTLNETGRESGDDFDYVGGEQVRVYANSRQRVTAQVEHSVLIDPGSVTFAFSGYLVKA